MAGTVIEFSFHTDSGDGPHTINLQRFYKRNGHKGRIQPNDTCLWLEAENEIIAAVRLSPSPTADGDYVLLKGLWVKRDLRAQSIGSKLLLQLNVYLTANNLCCYCLAYSHLEKFYRMHNYDATRQESAPSFLWQRFKRYQNRGKELILMQFQKNSI